MQEEKQAVRVGAGAVQSRRLGEGYKDFKRGDWRLGRDVSMDMGRYPLLKEACPLEAAGPERRVCLYLTLCTSGALAHPALLVIRLFRFPRFPLRQGRILSWFSQR